MEVIAETVTPLVLRNQRPQIRMAHASTLSMQTGPDATQARPFKLLWQMQGEMQVHQHGRSACIRTGQFTMLDGAAAFGLHADKPGTQLIVALPRQGVLGRYTGLHHQTARPHGDRPEEALLARFLGALAAHAADLPEASTPHAAAAVLALLGSLAQRQTHDSRAALRERALALLELDLANANAPALASRLRVSRRHLDAAFAATGKTLGQHLWDRRLALASEQLRSNTAKAVTQIAHELGFKDSSHFSRLFRQRFGLSPSHWRKGL